MLGFDHVTLQPAACEASTLPMRCRVAFFLIRVLFIYDAHLYYYLHKCGVLNEIIEPAIFVFKINTNKISNTRLRRISKHNLIHIRSLKIPTKHLLTF